MFDNANFDRGFETNLWTIKRERNKNHKAAFPKELIRRILRNFTSENEIIFDPFMGSGTVGVVCQEMKREFVGVEIDEKMFSIAQEQLNQLEL